MTLLRIFTVLAVAGGAAASRAEVWTVDAAVNTALRQNPDVQSARHRIEAASAMVKQADSAWLPQVFVTGSYTQSNSAMNGLTAALNQRNFSFDLNFNRPGWVDDLNLTGTAVYNLYNGGQPTARRAAARAGTRAAEQDLRAVQQQLATEVVKVMLTLHKAREGVAALEAGVKVYDASVANARLRFEAGQMLKADVLSLEVQAARTREQLFSARQGAALAARTFTFVLGGDPTSEPVELAPNDPALSGLIAPDVSDFSQRPELLGLQERLRAAEALVDAARGGHRPNVNAYVSAQYDQGWQYARHGDSLQGGVSVELSVFDGGRTNAKIRQATAELAQMKAVLRKTSLGIGLEVEQARLALATARERAAVTAGAVAQAEESAALSRARFEKGALLAVELIGAESRLIEMRLGQTLAAADERIAVIELRRALGLPPTAQP